MAGRPNKTSPILPSFDTSRGRWKIDVPASITGKRQKRFFESQADALLAASELAKSLILGTPIVPAKKKEGVNLRNLADAFLAEKKKSSSVHHHKSLRRSLEVFFQHFEQVPPEEITPSRITSWIKGLDGFSTRSRFNFFNDGKTFFNWRPIKDICKENPFQDAPPKRNKGHRADILTVEEMRELLALPLAPFFKSWLVCGAFAGLRTVEYERMTYEAIDRKHKEIVVTLEQSKQGHAARPRSISIQPAFLRHIPKGKGPLEGGATWENEAEEMKKALKAIGRDEWPKNCLRHSFASYHLAHFRDANKTAFEMGHTSSTLVYSTYANSVTRSAAEAWWGL